MLCPACKSDMLVVEYNRIELDFCANCHGVWFDKGELELLLGSLGLDSGRQFLDSLLHEEAETGERKRRCPLCRRVMKKVNLEKKVLVDVCSRGEGVWFDGGELRELVTELAQKMPAKLGASQTVINFLGEVFKAWE